MPMPIHALHPREQVGPTVRRILDLGSLARTHDTVPQVRFKRFAAGRPRHRRKERPSTAMVRSYQPEYEVFVDRGLESGMRDGEPDGARFMASSSRQNPPPRKVGAPAFCERG